MRCRDIPTNIGSGAVVNTDGNTGQKSEQGFAYRIAIVTNTAFAIRREALNTTAIAAVARDYRIAGWAIQVGTLPVRRETFNATAVEAVTR